MRWNNILRYLDGRCYTEVATEWHRQLNLKHIKGKWSLSEDILLFLAIEQQLVVQQQNMQDVGTSQAKTQQLAIESTRSLDQSAINNELNNNNSRTEYSQNISIRWSEVHKFFEHRNDVQIRERWSNVLDPALKECQWSLAEEQRLLDLSQKFDCRWSRISRELGTGKTDNQCFRRWRVLLGHTRNKMLFKQLNMAKKRENSADIFQIVSVGRMRKEAMQIMFSSISWQHKTQRQVAKKHIQQLNSIHQRRLQARSKDSEDLESDDECAVEYSESVIP